MMARRRKSAGDMALYCPRQWRVLSAPGGTCREGEHEYHRGLHAECQCCCDGGRCRGAGCSGTAWRARAAARSACSTAPARPPCAPTWTGRAAGPGPRPAAPWRAWRTPTPGRRPAAQVRSPLLSAQHPSEDHRSHHRALSAQGTTCQGCGPWPARSSTLDSACRHLAMISSSRQRVLSMRS